MRSARIATVFTALCVACDTGEPAAPTRVLPRRVETRDFASGSRLTAVAWDVDGALVLRHFFDRERGEPCAFVENGLAHVGPGSAHYCLPIGMARHDEGFGPFAVFSDRSCKVPLAVAPASGPATYAVTRPADACSAAPSIHRAGNVKTSFPWLFDGTSCRRAPVEIPTQVLGEAVPLEQFARAEERAFDRSSRIASNVAVTADGARQTLGGFDRVRQESVRFDGSTVGFPRWVPSRVAFQGAGEVLFGDAACSAPLATKIARDAVCPLTAALVFEGECGDARFHALGAPAERARIHGRDGEDRCVPAPEVGVFAFELGPPIDPSSFAPAFVVSGGGDRIQRRGLAGADAQSAVVAWGELLDTRTGEPCVPELAIDGVRRCLPFASATVDLFADAACTAPAFWVPASSCDRESPPRFVRAGSEAGARVFETTGDARDLHTSSSGACAPFVPLVPARGFAVREVEPSRFVEVSEREL